MSLIYRVLFFALLYAAIIWQIVRFTAPSFYGRQVNRYRRFELWIEHVDTASFFRVADLLSKLLFVTVASAFAGLLIAGAIAGVLHLAR